MAYQYRYENTDYQPRHIEHYNGYQNQPSLYTQNVNRPQNYFNQYQPNNYHRQAIFDQDNYYNDYPNESSNYARVVDGQDNYYNSAQNGIMRRGFNDYYNPNTDHKKIKNEKKKLSKKRLEASLYNGGYALNGKNIYAPAFPY